MENESVNHVRNNFKNKEVQHNMAGFPAQGSWGQNQGVSLAECLSEGSQEDSTSKCTPIIGRIQILVVTGLRSPLPGYLSFRSQSQLLEMNCILKTWPLHLQANEDPSNPSWAFHLWFLLPLTSEPRFKGPLRLGQTFLNDLLKIHCVMEWNLIPRVK